LRRDREGIFSASAAVSAFLGGLSGTVAGASPRRRRTMASPLIVEAFSRDGTRGLVIELAEGAMDLP
jgi:hypothetical protein